MFAPRAPVAADREQHRGTPTQRLVRQRARHRVPGRSLTPAAATPPIPGDDPRGQDRTIPIESLSDHFKAELVEPAERGQVKAGEGSVTHVEVFRRGPQTPIGGARRQQDANEE